MMLRMEDPRHERNKVDSSHNRNRVLRHRCCRSAPRATLALPPGRGERGHHPPVGLGRHYPCQLPAGRHGAAGVAHRRGRIVPGIFYFCVAPRRHRLQPGALRLDLEQAVTNRNDAAMNAGVCGKTHHLSVAFQSGRRHPRPALMTIIGIRLD